MRNFIGEYDNRDSPIIWPLYRKYYKISCSFDRR